MTVVVHDEEAAKEIATQFWIRQVDDSVAKGVDIEQSQGRTALEGIEAVLSPKAVATSMVGEVLTRGASTLAEVVTIERVVTSHL